MNYDVLCFMLKLDLIKIYVKCTVLMVRILWVERKA